MGADRKDPDSDTQKTVRLSPPRATLDDEDLTPARPSSTQKRPVHMPPPPPPVASARVSDPKTSLPTGQSAGHPRAHYAPKAPHAIPPRKAPATPPPKAPIILADDVEDKTVPDMTPLFGLRDTEVKGDDASTTVPLGKPREKAPPPVPAPPAPAVQAVTGVLVPSRPRSMEKTQIVARPRAKRPASATRILRRGPSTQDKILAFIGVLIFMTACGIAIIAWQRPTWFGIGSKRTPTKTNVRPEVAPAKQPPAPSR